MSVVPTKPERTRYRRDGPAVHLSVAEQVALGKAARSATPRSSHAVFEPTALRADPVTLLEQQAASRVPELVPIRYGRMASSPFAYFRGAALPMAADLAGTPTSGLRVQACGDAHLSNFGMFASPERRLVFDINDFDETVPGPWEWDVKRLAASLAVASRSSGFSTKERRRILLATVAAYRTSMARFAGQDNLAVWYARMDVEQLMADLAGQVDATRMRRLAKMTEKARDATSESAVRKLTTLVDGEPRFASQPPLLMPVEDLLPSGESKTLQETVRSAMRAYRRTLTTDRRHLLAQYRYVQLARKVVGVGSVGTRAWVVLLLGRDADDPLVLQVKEAQESVLEPYVGRSEYASSGQRVVAGQRLMQATSDIFLGWQRINGLDGLERDFYVRQLKDWKGSIPIEALLPHGMEMYGRVCGWTLARAHARSGDRIAIAAYLGTGSVFDRAVADFAETYADQNERDYAALLAAIDSGRVAAETGL